jgi:predicted CoA-substrate-specific enzyme activase
MAGCGSHIYANGSNDLIQIQVPQEIQAGADISKKVSEDRLMIGLDVGSTTVKAVVIDPKTDQILWRDYQRHETKQPEKVLEFLKQIEEAFPQSPEKFRIFATGSGGGVVARLIGAKFVQEVNAVSLAVEKLYPEAGSVIELGGQDAKIIIFKEDLETGKKKKVPSMNDKCAGGTGTVIDKINAKLKIPPEQLTEQRYFGLKLHPVAGKCGVFAETDINGLQKLGVPPDELMASLFEAIIQQNLSVLTRGNTLRPHVLLLGGPNTYIKGMQECWKANIPKIWEERKVSLPEGVDPIDLIKVPQNAQYFAAIGAVEFGKEEYQDVGIYRGSRDLEYYINYGRNEEKAKKACGGGLNKSTEELDLFKERFRKKKFVPETFIPGEVVEGFLGIDGGSTSTKAVLLNKEKEILVKSYQLSNGNPIQDTVEIIGKIRSQIESQGAILKVLGVGTTGYAKDILKDVLGADAAIVETVAHTESGLHFYKNIDVICDIGGQDIKLMFLMDGRVKDFKLNTQCSAGNGYFLQSTAEGFGFPVEEFADQAFSAKDFPEFGYGCAVFLQSDIVDFQRQGWKPEEIMAGLANVLPKNIWLYVSQIPNLSSLGTRFLLQGGTQHNLAAVKAQVDFIESRFKDKGIKPEIIVHEHTGESGAIGAALEAHRLWVNGRQTTFIGLNKVSQITYKATRSEDTRCYFCKNRCIRTFIDFKTSFVQGEITGDSAPATTNQKIPEKLKSKIPLEFGTQRLIIATCEKGTVEDLEDMKQIKKGLDTIKRENPNLSEIAGESVWESFKPEMVTDPIPKYAFTRKAKQRIKRMENRRNIRVGIPRVLNLYSQNPLFSAYFESLGILPGNLVYSDFTSESLYKEGIKRGSIDPCFPSKVAISHIHNLLYVHHKKKKLHYLFFPMIDSLTSDLKCIQATRACPTVSITPEAVKAAFTKEGNLFKEMGVVYVNPFLKISERKLFTRQMYEQFKDILGLSEEENERAIAQGFKALDHFNNNILRGIARKVLDRLVAEDRLGIVILARPYHNDPGINHGILEEFQKLGYPILTQDALPIDEDILEQLFGEEVRKGIIKHPMDISDVWKHSYSENTNRKIWAAKYVARHPNLVALELSNFKCGHDAPIYSLIEDIVEKSGTPYFSFKDIDENKPKGSIKIRVETIDYFLKRYREEKIKERQKRRKIEEQLKTYEAKLRAVPQLI